MMHMNAKILQYDLTDSNETETGTYLDRLLWLENIKKTEAIYANKMSAATEIRCPQCNSLYVAPSPENKNRLECKECGTLF